MVQVWDPDTSVLRIRPDTTQADRPLSGFADSEKCHIATTFYFSDWTHHLEAETEHAPFIKCRFCDLGYAARPFVRAPQVSVASKMDDHVHADHGSHATRAVQATLVDAMSLMDVDQTHVGHATSHARAHMVDAMTQTDADVNVERETMRSQMPTGSDDDIAWRCPPMRGPGSPRMSPSLTQPDPRRCFVFHAYILD